mgnify:CR=1 FL=1
MNEQLSVIDLILHASLVVQLVMLLLAGFVLSRLFHPDMPSGKSRTQRTAGIAGRRLYPEIVKYFLAQQRAVGYAIKRHPAGHNQIITAG